MNQTLRREFMMLLSPGRVPGAPGVRRDSIARRGLQARLRPPRLVRAITTMRNTATATAQTHQCAYQITVFVVVVVAASLELCCAKPQPGHAVASRAAR